MLQSKKNKKAYYHIFVNNTDKIRLKKFQNSLKIWL